MTGINEREDFKRRGNGLGGTGVRSGCQRWRVKELLQTFI